MTDDAVQWLFSLERLGMKFGLENMTKLLAELGNPQQAFASIHVGGTNGKGSVTAILETALRHARYRTGRYTSPHLERIEERFVIEGQDVDRPSLERAVSRVRAATTLLMARGEFTSLPTFFEAATAAAFDLFREARVEIAVVEVGLGGRLDSTNVIQPVACAITTIALDHQAQLGTTIESIAGEKAGIIKPGVPVVIGRLPAAAEAVIGARAAREGAPLIRAHERPTHIEDMSPALRGAHQRDNAIVALAVLDVLRDRGFPVSDEDARYGVESVRWPGRLEHLALGQCEVILDAAHNPAGARSLAEYLRSIGWTGATLVFGAMADKDIEGMLAELAPAAGRIVFTTAGTSRAASAEALEALAAHRLPGHPPFDVIAEPFEALRSACASSPRVVVAGSMFLIGPLRGILR